MKFNRVFLLVLDSVGVGEAPDAESYGDIGANTLKHLSQDANMFIPNLMKLGFLNTICDDDLPADAYYTIAKPVNKGKDCFSGHYEMMGIYLDKPFKSFSNSGLPMELIKEIEAATGRRIIGNIPSLGDDLIKELGQMQVDYKALILYTQGSNIFVTAHEKVISFATLCDIGEVIRKLTVKDENRVEKVIVKSFTGEDKDSFTFTNSKKELVLDPLSPSVLNSLVENKFSVISVGKVFDLFNGVGFSKRIMASNNKECMDKIIDLTDKKFKGLCFANLSDFNDLYGSMRNITGYKEAIEALDVEIPMLLNRLNNDDLLIICADHGSDPTFKGNEETRENVPVLVYSRLFTSARKMKVCSSLADIGATIADIFEVSKPMIGMSFLDQLK